MEQEKQVFEFDGKEYSEEDKLILILEDGTTISGFFTVEELEEIRNVIIFIDIEEHESTQ